MKSNDGKPVVRKIAEIMDCFLEGRSLSLSEIGKEAGIPQPTALRLLKELSALNYVSRDPISKTYCAGVKVLQLADALKSRMDVRAVALPIMHRLADQTRETVQLIILVGNQGVCIERVDGSELFRVYSAVGRIVPLHGGAATKAILAFLPEEQRNVLLSEPLEALTPNTKTQRDSIEAEISQIRLAGVAVSREELALGVAGVGAPIFDHTGHVRAGIGVAGPASRLDDEAMARFAEHVKRAAREISDNMGYRPPN